MSRRTYFVYILASKSRVLYVGVTNDLERRIHKHKNKATQGFTSRYYIDKLVYVEETGNIEAAIAREKEIKDWVRAKKVSLIEGANLRWLDLSAGWNG